MNDDELTALLDRAIGPGPDGPHLDVVLRAGGRAARRRRTTAVALTIAAVLAIGGTAVALSGGDSPTTVQPAVDATPGPPLATDTVSLDDFLESGDLVELRAGGLLRVRPGVEILEWVDNPMGVTPPDFSMGLVLRYEGEVTWKLADYDDLGEGAASVGGASTTPGEEAATFEQWLAEQAELATAPEPDLDDALDDALGDADSGKQLVELQADGSLALVDGVEVLDRIENPVGHTLPNRSVAVAFTYEGRERWATLQVLVENGRVTGGGAVTRYADQVPDETFEEFVARDVGKVFHP